MAVRVRTKIGVALGGAVAVTLAARRVEMRWATAHDPVRPHEGLVPVGEAHTVPVDDGAELAVTVAGEGPTVVLSHCWTGASEVWAPVAHRLVASGHRVVLYDQRGHGSSTSGSDGFTIARLGADLVAVLEQLDLTDAVLVGHSLGGMTIQALAGDHLDVLERRASGLVLVATAASGLGRGRRGPMMARVLGGRSVDRVLRLGIGHAFLRGTVGRSVRRNHIVVTRDLFVACPPDVRSGFFSAMQTMDLREGIRHITLPVTVVAGTHDLLTPADRSAELVDTIPGARLVTLQDGGHMLPLEAPDEVADTIVDAVGRRRAAGGPALVDLTEGASIVG